MHLHYTKNNDGETSGVTDETGCFFKDHERHSNLAVIGLNELQYRTINKDNLKQLMIGWLLFNFPDSISIKDQNLEAVNNELYAEIDRLTYELSLLEPRGYDV